MTQRYVTVILLWLAAAAQPVFSKGSGGLPGAYLNLPINTISYTVSIPGEINPSYLNPAGLFMVNQNDVTLYYNKLYEGTQFMYLCYAYPIRLLGTLAISQAGIGNSQFERRDNFARPQGFFGMGESVYLVTYAHKILPWMLLGTNFKITNQNLDEFNTYNIGNDVGIEVMPYRNVFGGLNIQNLVRPKMKLRSGTDTWPTNINIGGVYNRLLNERLALAMDLSVFDIATDADMFKKGQPMYWSYNFHYGMKYSFMKNVALRMGFDRREYTVGFGLFYRGLQVDYTFGYHAELGANHRISTIGRFGLDRATKEDDRLRRMAERDRLLRPTAIYKDAMGLYGQKKNWEAAFNFGEIAAVYPDFEKADKAMIYAAEAMNGINMNDAALGIYKNFLTKFTLSPYRARALYKMQKIYYQKGDYDNALVVYTRLAKQYANTEFFGPASYLAGQCFFKKKMYEDAVATLKYIPERDESFVAAQYTMGMCRLEMNDLEKAADHFRNVVAVPEAKLTEENQRTTVQKAILNLGRLCYQLARYDEALEHYQKIKPGSPYYPAALTGMAWCYINKGEYDKAAELLNKIMAEYPGSDDALDACLSLAHCYTKLEQHEKSAELYRKVITTCSENDLVRLKQRNLVEKKLQSEYALDQAQKNLASVENLIASNTVQLPALRKNKRNLFAQYERYHETVDREQGNIALADQELKRKERIEKILQTAQYALPMMIQKLQVSVDKGKMLDGFENQLTALRQQRDSTLAAESSAVRAELERTVGAGKYTPEQVQSAYLPRKQAAEGRLGAALDSVSRLRDEKVAQYDVDERKRRAEAIEQYKRYLLQYQDISSADIMLQLAQLYYEQEKDDYMGRMDEYDKGLEKFYKGEAKDTPPEPRPDYTQTINLYQDLIKKYPDSPSVDRALYALGYCHVEMGNRDQARNVFQDLYEKYPGSTYYPEAALRLGEYYFMNNNYEKAISFYKKVMPYKDNPHFEKAIYKLGWSYYKLNDYESAINTFVSLVDLSEQEGRDSDLRKEAMDYIAIGFNEYGGLGSMLAYFKKVGGRPYEKDLLYKLGDVYKTIDKTGEAVETYQTLLSLYPDYPMAAEVQNSIIECHHRNRDAEQTIAARETFIKNYAPGTTWREKYKENEKLTAMATELLERNINEAATYYHAQARQNKDPQLYDQAVRHYRSYLQTFPASPKKYTLHYLMAEALYEKGALNEAADEYRAIAFNYKDENKFQEDAAYNVIICYELQKKELIKDQVKNQGPIRELNKKIMEASQAYRKLLPASEKVPQLLFAEAGIQYADSNYAEARQVYEAVITGYPDNSLAPRAYEMIALSYSKQKDFVKAEEWYKKLIHSGKVAPERMPEIQKFASVTIYERAGSLRELNQLTEAAQEFERLVREYPQDANADAALADAGLCYEKMEKWGYAVRAYEKLANDYPKSKRSEESLYRASACHEKLGNNELAAENYWQLAENFPKSQYASAALYNAGVNYEKIKKYDLAAKCYQRLGKDYPESELAPDAFLGVAENFEASKDWGKAAELFGQFAKVFPGNKALVVEALCREGLALYESGKKAEAKPKLEQAVFEAKRWKDVNEFYPAKAQYILGEIAREPFEAISFKLPVEKMKEDVKKKSELLKDVISNYTATIKSGVAEWATAATYRLGSALESYADCLMKQERVPQDKENAFAFEIQLRMKQVPQFLLKSSNYYKTNIEMARNAKIENEWVQKSEDKLIEITFRVGSLYEEIAELFRNAPLPDGLTKDEQDEYKYALEDKAFGFEDNAVQVFEANLKQARAYGIKNDWVQRSLNRLAKIAPNRYAGSEAQEAADSLGLSIDTTGGALPPGQRDSLRQLARVRGKGAAADTLMASLTKTDTTQTMQLDSMIQSAEQGKTMDQQVAEYRQLESTLVAQSIQETTTIRQVRDSINTVSTVMMSVQIEIAKLNELDTVVTGVNKLMAEFNAAPADRKAALKQELTALDQKLYDLSVPPISNISDVMRFIKYKRKDLKDLINQP
jgi:TolA-binding protein